MTAFGDAGVAAARVSRAGIPLDDGGLGVAPVAVSGDSSIAFTGSTYLIAWIGSAVYTRRYARDGAPIDPAPVLIQTVTTATGYYHPRRIAVAGNGKAFLVVWIDSGRPDAQFPTLFGATIAVDGTVSAARPIIGVSYYDSDPDVACNGQTCLIIWGRMSLPPFEGPPTRTGTWAVHVAGDGAPIGVSPFIEMPDLMTRSATVASNGRDFLVTADGSRDLLVVPITTTGRTLTVGSPKTLFRWLCCIQSDITSDANGYAISWRYPEPSSVPYDPRIRASQWYLAVAHLNSGGDRYSGAFTSISVATFDLTFDLARLSTASNQLGDTAVTIREQLPGSVPRVRAYFDWEITPMPPPPSPPRNVAVTGSRDNFIVSWESTTNDATGFVVEVLPALYGGTFDFSSVVPGDQRSVSIRYWTVASAVRVRALNAGGMSEASEPVPVVKPLPRRRVIGSR
jgi:hypothetical protein